MGASCSTQLKNAKEEIKILKEKLSRFEAGGSDNSIRASQTNIGLFNLAEENNEECGCAGSSGGSMLTIIEVIAILITAIIILYIAYRCCININARRKEEKEKTREKRRKFIMREMESRMGPSGQVENRASLAIECDKDHLHFPRYHKVENTLPPNHTDNIETSNKSTQDISTFT